MIQWKDLAHEEKIALVQEQISNRKTASEIASLFRGATRNAIIGFCHRAKLRLPGKQKEKHGGPRRATTRVRRTTAKRISANREAGELSEAIEIMTVQEGDPGPIDIRTSSSCIPDEPDDVEAPAETGPVSMMNLTAKHCRWPMNYNYKGVAVEEMTFCGKPIIGDSVYCRECHGRAYVGAPVWKKSGKEYKRKWQT